MDKKVGSFVALIGALVGYLVWVVIWLVAYSPSLPFLSIWALVPISVGVAIATIICLAIALSNMMDEKTTAGLKQFFDL